jgi:DnaK suppressor protein
VSGSKAAANGAAAAAIPARTTFTPKPKAPPPVRPKTGPYAKDAKFLDEVRELLVADRAIYQEQATSLRAEADSLALEREPGDVQFDEESGEGGTVTVDRERNLALSGQATLAVEEIDDALKRIDDKTYGYCERCFQPIPKPRLRALPYARLCVACKSGGLSRR